MYLYHNDFLNKYGETGEKLLTVRTIVRRIDGETDTRNGSDCQTPPDSPQAGEKAMTHSQQEVREARLAALKAAWTVYTTARHLMNLEVGRVWSEGDYERFDKHVAQWQRAELAWERQYGKVPYNQLLRS